MSRCVGGTLAVLCLLTGTAVGDVIVNGTFGSSGPAYWNNPSSDGTGCYNIGCIVGGQYGAAGSPNLNSLSWATNSAQGLGDFYFQGDGSVYQLSVLSNATANILEFGIYDPANPTNHTVIFDGSLIPKLQTTDFSQLGSYGFYMLVKYTCDPGACPPNLEETYRSESSGNTHVFTITSLSTAQHFAAFQTTNGFVIGAEDGLFWNGPNPTEGTGDFQDLAIQFNLQTQAVPEPASIALFSAGAVGLLALKRRRRA